MVLCSIKINPNLSFYLVSGVFFTIHTSSDVVSLSLALNLLCKKKDTPPTMHTTSFLRGLEVGGDGGASLSLTVGQMRVLHS